MASAKLRIAVAGAGSFGREHLRTLTGIEGVSIVGIADTDPHAAMRAAAQFGGTPEPDAIAMIEGLRPDGLVVASPGHTHVAFTCAALDLGIPVLLEKPVGFTAADADVLIAAERKSGTFVLPGHILRFSAHYRTIVGIAQSGEIGRPLSVGMRNHRDETHATRYPDVDPVLMTMVHDIDLSLWITGGKLDTVYARRHPADGFRSETLILGGDSTGCLWHISNAWTYPTTAALPDRLEILGEQGGAELELGRSIRVFGKTSREIDISGEDDMLRTELLAFCEAIRSGRKPETVTLEDARNGLRAADAIRESLRSGAEVRT